MQVTLGINPGGRKPNSHHRSIRLKHIRCAYHHHIDGHSLSSLARKYRVCRTTIYNWIKAVETYTDVEAVMLGELVRGGPPAGGNRRGQGDPPGGAADPCC